MNNKWNKTVYRLWSPVYDHLFNGGIFREARKEVFRDITWKEGEKVLFAGVGTGADLAFVHDPGDIHIAAIDYSPHMLEKAKARFAERSIDFYEMDAQHMSFEDESFDWIVASLVLSVVPNPDKCLKEMARVLKPGGSILIFDKFRPAAHQKRSWLQTGLSPLIKVLGTDISLSAEKLMEGQREQLKVETDHPIMLNGMYRRLIARKYRNGLPPSGIE